MRWLVLKKKYKAVCFDMDGSFFQNIKSIDYLCMANKKEKELKEIELMESNNDVTWIKSDYLRVKLLKGLKQTRVNESFKNGVKLNNGIRECVESIKAQNMKIFLITSGPIDMAKIIAHEFSFEEFTGSEYELLNGEYTGEISNHLDGEEKFNKLKEFCKKSKVKLKECIAVGDSISDVNVFDNCGKRIAINFSNALINRSDEYVATNDLKDIINFFQNC